MQIILNWSKLIHVLFSEQDGIEPMWEDERNKRGGRWLITLSKQQRRADLDRFWLETVNLYSSRFNCISCNIYTVFEDPKVLEVLSLALSQFWFCFSAFVSCGRSVWWPQWWCLWCCRQHPNKGRQNSDMDDRLREQRCHCTHRVKSFSPLKAFKLVFICPTPASQSKSMHRIKSQLYIFSFSDNL